MLNHGASPIRLLSEILLKGESQRNAVLATFRSAKVSFGVVGE
jgi:hypothetical protein